MTRTPKVCLVSHTYLEKRYRGKLSRLAQSVDLTVITPEQFPFPYGTYHADFSEPRSYAVRAYPCRFPLGIRTSTRWVLATRDLGFRTVQPDIIHVENEAHSFSLLQALVCRRRYVRRAKAIAFVWSNMSLPGLRGHGLNLMARLMRAGIDHYIAGNSDAKRLLIASGIPDDRISVFPQVGVDVDYYKPPLAEERSRLRSEMGFGPGDFVVGFVGRFVQDKGIPDLLEAVRRLREMRKVARVRLMCVGDGPLKSSLPAGCPDVTVASPGGAGRVLPYYQVMDVLVLPSRSVPRWKEQFGLVLVEAMACGVPVVGSNSGAIPEVMGNAGCVFKERDAADLAARLCALMAAPGQRLAMGEAGRKRALDTFSHSRVAEQMYQTYQQVLSGEQPR